MLKDDAKKPMNKDMLTEEHGACKFCGQMAVLQVPETWDDEMINEYATELCKCSDAQVYTSRKQRLEKAEEIIDRTFTKPKMMISDQAIGTLKRASACIIAHEFESIQLRDGEVTATIAKGSDGKIVISGSYKEKDSGKV